ncbi:unnamed protein product [Danaus chrysippus]|uniref:(African queen) hypothetical protein n=1 Tax=Danaus chrysippus TaxID=151541 RepID=A0A8J2QPC7_9NEOP|nr:unnamed protein product [Danaus chrysippus]
MQSIALKGAEGFGQLFLIAVRLVSLFGEWRRPYRLGGAGRARSFELGVATIAHPRQLSAVFGTYYCKFKGCESSLLKDTACSDTQVEGGNPLRLEVRTHGGRVSRGRGGCGVAARPGRPSSVAACSAERACRLRRSRPAHPTCSFSKRRRRRRCQPRGPATLQPGRPELLRSRPHVTPRQNECDHCLR